MGHSMNVLAEASSDAHQPTKVPLLVFILHPVKFNLRWFEFTLLLILFQK